MKTKVYYKNRFRIVKKGCIALCITAFAGTTLLAAPSGGVVVNGSGTILQNANTTTINQNSSKLSINWQKFNIAKNEIVNFNQPNKNAIALNRVIGNEKSIINGALNANGQVWLLNSNGVLFGKDASINTAGFLATTKALSDEDFNSGKYHFKNESSNSIINQGEITVSDSSYVALLAKEVKNEGTIKAVKGKIHLVGANEFEINLNGNSLVSLSVKKGVVDALVENKGAILNNAGEIYLTTNSVNELLKGVVNNEGVLEANSIDDVLGKVELFAHGGKAKVDGTIKAKDGFVETSGKDIDIKVSANIEAKTWLIDPTTIDISDSTAYETSLNSGTDIHIQTQSEGSEEGNIYINDEITWNADSKLTLDAHKDIYVNKKITSTHDNGKVALHYGQGAVALDNTSDYHINAPINLKAGDNFETKLGSDGSVEQYRVITELGVKGSTTGTDLQGMQGNLSRNYVLGANIDAIGTEIWNEGRGFSSIGGWWNEFSNTFDGLGHTISNLTSQYGLFNRVENSKIQNIGLLNTYVENTAHSIGGLVGYLDYSTIKNSYSIGDIKGNRFAGGLVGHVTYSLIENSYSKGTVEVSSDVVGGLVGALWEEGVIKNSYSTADVRGKATIGGLSGFVYNNSKVENSYAIGNLSVIPTEYSYSTTNRGLVGGSINSSIINSFWNTDIVEESSYYNESGVGLTTSQMKNTASFFNSSWDFDTIWGRDTNNVLNNGYPVLKVYHPDFNFKTVVGAKLDSQSKIYDATDNIEATFSKNNIISQLKFIGIKDAGTYTFSSKANDYTATFNDGYDLSNTEFVIDTSAELFIRKKYLDLSDIVAQDKIYDGTNDANTTATIDGLIGDETVSIESSFSDKNIGTSKIVTIDNLLGEDAHNYAVEDYVTRANITPKELSLSDIIAQDKIYDGTNDANTTATIDGLIGDETVSIVSVFSDRNVGSNKRVFVEGLEGSDAHNYAVADYVTNANITPKELSLSDIIAQDKIYDGTVNANIISSTLNGVEKKEDVSFINSSVFSNKKAGYDKQVILNTTLEGSDASNYVINTHFTNANIRKKYLDLSDIIAQDKIYDGTNDANTTATIDGLIGDETVSIESSFSDKNVGTSKIVTIDNLLGEDAHNYAVEDYVTRANITPKELSLSDIIAQDKVYDGTVNTNIISSTLNGVEKKDDVSFINNSVFSNKNAGYDKQVIVNTTLDGSDANNYVINTHFTNANIRKKYLDLSDIIAQDKIYDGTADANVTATLDGVVKKDDVSFINSSVFSDKNAGFDKQVIVNTTLDGADANNYVINTHFTNANITPKELSLSDIIAQDKIYDGTVNTNIISSTLNGVEKKDDVSFINNSVFSNKNAGYDKQVIVNTTLEGSDASNYVINTHFTYADISPKEVEVNLSSKVVGRANNSIYKLNNIFTSEELFRENSDLLTYKEDYIFTHNSEYLKDGKLIEGFIKPDVYNNIGVYLSPNFIFKDYSLGSVTILPYRSEQEKTLTSTILKRPIVLPQRLSFNQVLPKLELGVNTFSLPQENNLNNNEEYK